MQDVGPASYETFDKQVSIPMNLRANIAPVVIKKDMEKEMRRSSDTVLNQKMMATGDDSSLQDIVRL